MEAAGKAQEHRGHSPAFLLLAIVAGLAAAWGWMHFSQPLVDTIQVSSIAVLATIYYALVYVPLGALALALASLCGVHAWYHGRNSPSGIVSGLLLGAGGMAIAAALAAINGGMVSANGAAKASGNLIAIGGALILFQVAVEELLFRGWLRLTLEHVLGKRAGVAVAALGYAGFVVAGSGFALLPFVNLALLGLFFGLLAQRTGGIAAPVAAHFGWSLIEDIGLGLNPNPGVGPFGAIRDFDLLGAPLWGGSEAGLAASVGTSAVLLAFVLPLLRRVQEPEPQPA